MATSSGYMSASPAPNPMSMLFTNVTYFIILMEDPKYAFFQVYSFAGCCMILTSSGVN